MTGFNERDDEKQNICAYTWHVIFGVLVCFVLLVAITTIEYLLVEFALGVYFSILYKTFMFSDVGVAVLGILCFSLILLFIFHGIPWLFRKTKKIIVNTVSDTPVDSFVKEAYQSWKGKYCKKVEFK
jgi:hypothetical protein